ncbi:MAG: hypothetical protein FJW23_05740 [Acidimicrobiia bacterium]|nr:hypothetical protein [Acidimicrobiia bacterium]
MRARQIAVAAAVAAWGLGLMAAEPAPESFVKAMKDMNTAMLTIRSGVQAGDFGSVAKAAATIEGLLKENGTFWEKRKTATAITHNDAALKAVGELGAAAKTKDRAGAMAAQKTLNTVCNNCHAAHRERTPDGKYVIK